MYLLDAMYEEKKVKRSVILSMLGTIPLLLAGVFAAKCSLAGKGNVAAQAAVIVCGIMFLKTFGKFLFKKTTYQFIELAEFKAFPIFLWLFKGLECVLYFCLWQELGLGFLVVYLFGTVVHSNALWIKHELDTWYTDMEDMRQTFGGEMTLGSIVIAIGTVLCGVRLMAVAVWSGLYGFSANLFSEGAFPWNMLILVSLLLYSLTSGGYCGSLHRLASFLVLIPAFILLWESVGNISIPGVLVMYFGMLVYQSVG